MLGTLAFGALGGWIAFANLPNGPTNAQAFWYPATGTIAGVVIGLVGIFLLIFAWSLFRAPYRELGEARSTIRNLWEMANLRFLGFGVNRAEHRDHASVFTPDGQEVRYLQLQLELRLRNTGDVSIQYEIKEMDVTIHGVSNPNPQMHSWGTIVPPQSDEIFRYDWVRGIRADRSPMHGQVSYQIEWWMTGSPNDHKSERCAFALTYWPDENRLDWVNQSTK